MSHFSDGGPIAFGQCVGLSMERSRVKTRVLKSANKLKSYLFYEQHSVIGHTKYGRLLFGRTIFSLPSTWFIDTLFDLHPTESHHMLIEHALDSRKGSGNNNNNNCIP